MKVAVHRMGETDSFVDKELTFSNFNLTISESLNWILLVETEVKGTSLIHIETYLVLGQLN